MSDFDQIINRTKTNSIKWHVAKNELPMWIADMDFKTSPAIVQALQEKVRDGIFGYEEIPPAYFNAVANWYERVHGFRPDPGMDDVCNRSSSRAFFSGSSANCCRR